MQNLIINSAHCKLATIMLTNTRGENDISPKDPLENAVNDELTQLKPFHHS